MGFQKIVLIVAGVILLLSLIAIGVAVYKQQFNSKYPPLIGDCPDYWELQTTDDGKNFCVNVKNLGNCKENMNFNKYPYNGIDGNCRKAQWAKGCNLTWDGLTNNPDICDLKM